MMLIIGTDFSLASEHQLCRTLTDVVLLYVADVAVDGGVAEDDYHHHIACVQLGYVRKMALHGIDLPMSWCTGFPLRPCLGGYVKHPQFICYITSAHL